MDFLTLVWQDILIQKRRFWGWFLSSLISPILYLLAFGWGLGQKIQVDGHRYMEFVIPGIIALSAMTNSYGWIAMRLAVSRLYFRTFQEYLTSPIKPVSICLGKVFSGALRGLYASIVIIIISFILGAELKFNLLFLIALILTCFLFASLGVISGIIAQSHESSSNFSNFVILPMSFLCGTFFSLERLPGIIKGVIQALPLTHSVLCLRAVNLSQPFPYISLLYLVFLNIVFFLLGLNLVKRYSE